MSNDAQRQAALLIANERREAKARIKRSLREMPRDNAHLLVADLFDGTSDIDDSTIGSFKFLELLAAIPQFGPMKAGDIADHIGLRAMDRRLRAMTNRQRVAVADALREPRRIWPAAKRVAA